MDARNLLTTKEVAAMLGRSHHTVRNRRFHRLHLPFIHIGKKVFYDRKDVEAYLDSHTERVEVAG